MFSVSIWAPKMILWRFFTNTHIIKISGFWSTTNTELKDLHRSNDVNERIQSTNCHTGCLSSANNFAAFSESPCRAHKVFVTSLGCGVERINCTTLRYVVSYWLAAQTQVVSYWLAAQTQVVSYWLAAQTHVVSYWLAAQTQVVSYWLAAQTQVVSYCLTAQTQVVSYWLAAQTLVIIDWLSAQHQASV